VRFSFEANGPAREGRYGARSGLSKRNRLQGSQFVSTYVECEQRHAFDISSDTYQRMPCTSRAKTFLVFLYSLYRTRVDVLDAGILRYVVPKRRLNCVSGLILDKQLGAHCLVFRFLDIELTGYTLTHMDAVRWKTKLTSYPGYSVEF